MNASKKLAAVLINMRNKIIPGFNKGRHLSTKIILLLVLAIFIPACAGANSRNAAEQDTVPNLLGLPADHAGFYLDQFGLQYSLEEIPVDVEQKRGTILEQYPSPGETIEPGSSISLVVGEYSEVVVEEPEMMATEIKPVEEDGTNDDLILQTPPITETVEIQETLVPTAAGPTPTGGGNDRLVFASDRSGEPQLWLTDIEGEDKSQLTFLDGGACEPDWSPDGSMIIFISPCDGKHDQYPGSSIWMMEAGGGDEHVLPGMAGADFYPVWSPDGKKVAFTSIRDGGISQIYIYDVDTQEVENISNNSANEFQPDWSPDGTTIAFISTSPGSSTVMFKDMESRKTSQFTRDTERNYAYPLWMPDGTGLIFSLVPDGGIPSMMSANLVDQGFIIGKILTSFPMPIRGVSVSPDGKWIAYESWLDGANHDIWIQSLDGEEQIRITSEKSYDFDPDWYPGSLINE